MNTNCLKTKGKIYTRYASLVIMNLVLIIATVLFAQIKPIDHLREYRIRRINGSTEQWIYGDRSINQSFCCQEKVDSFEIQISAANSNYHGCFEVRLFDDEGNQIANWKTDKLDLTSQRQGKDGWIYYRFNDPEASSGRKYRIEITASELDEDSAIVISTADKSITNLDEGNETGTCLLNGEETDQVLPLAVYLRHENIFFILAEVVLFLLANIWWFNREKKIEKLAFTILLGTGLIMLLIMAPSSQPDETYHYGSAMKLSNIILGKKEVSSIPDYLKQVTSHQNYNDTYLKLLENNISDQDDTAIFWLSGTDYLQYPQGYLAPAIGMTLGRLLGLSQIYIYELARLFTLLSYIGMAMIAIRLIPGNKLLMLMICIIPMSMHQAVSTSRDVLVNGMSLIYFAHYMRLIYRKKPYTWGHAVISFLMLAFFGPVKVVYCVLAVLVLLIPANHFRNRWDRLLKVIFVPVCTFAFLLIMERTNLELNLTASTWDGLTDYYHLQFVFEHPARFVRLVLGHMVLRCWNFLQEAVGVRLAGLSVNISDYLVVAYMIILVLAAIRHEDDEPILITRQRWVLFLTAIIGYGLLTSAFVFANTLYGRTEVAGIQGRYLIPFIPLLLFAVDGKKVVAHFSNYKLWYAVWVIELGFIVDVMSQITIE